MARRFPIPVRADDPRFTFGLLIDVARVLNEHGYPNLAEGYDDAGLDLVELHLALFGFLYSEPTLTTETRS